MNQRTKNTTNMLIKISAITILITAIGCSTTNKRDERLSQNLEMQNAVIDAAKADRASAEVQTEIQKSEALVEAESKLGKALDALKEANNTVLGKMKPNPKKECANGKDEGDDNEQ